MASFLAAENLGTLGGVDVRVEGKFYIECKEKQSLPKWFTLAWEQAMYHAKENIPVLHIHPLYNKVEEDFIILNAGFFKKLLENGLKEMADRIFDEAHTQQSIS